MEWVVGEQVDGTDSVAKQLAPANHWKEMAVVIVVVSVGEVDCSKLTVISVIFLIFSLPSCSTH